MSRYTGSCPTENGVPDLATHRENIQAACAGVETTLKKSGVQFFPTPPLTGSPMTDIPALLDRYYYLTSLAEVTHRMATGPLRTSPVPAPAPAASAPVAPLDPVSQLEPAELRVLTWESICNIANGCMSVEEAREIAQRKLRR